MYACIFSRCVVQSLSQFPSKNVSKFHVRCAIRCQNSNAEQFQDKSVKMFQNK